MMRFFKKLKKVDWKYIVTEVLLIFIGINLAIWFNNWNTSKKINEDKRTALIRISEEIKNNQNELADARKSNRFFVKAYRAHHKLFLNNSDTLITTPNHLFELQKKYSNFYQVADSIKYTNGTYLYRGGVNIDLELIELNQIAWETTKSMNIANHFSYECLYELSGTYSLQQKVDAENELLTAAILSNDLKGLVRILLIMGQLEEQLLVKYEKVLASLPDCH